MKLFCIPYAGGSAFFYSQWSSHLNGIAEIIPVELAGRGRRVHEPFYRSFEEAVEDITSIIVPQLSGAPYGIFGHSLGANLAYETIHQLKSGGIRSLMSFFSQEDLLRMYQTRMKLSFTRSRMKSLSGT